MLTKFKWGATAIYNNNQNSYEISTCEPEIGPREGHSVHDISDPEIIKDNLMLAIKDHCELALPGSFDSNIFPSHYSNIIIKDNHNTTLFAQWDSPPSQITSNLLTTQGNITKFYKSHCTAVNPNEKLYIFDRFQQLLLSAGKETQAIAHDIVVEFIRGLGHPQNEQLITCFNPSVNVTSSIQNATSSSIPDLSDNTSYNSYTTFSTLDLACYGIIGLSAIGVAANLKNIIDHWKYSRNIKLTRPALFIGSDDTSGSDNQEAINTNAGTLINMYEGETTSMPNIKHPTTFDNMKSILSTFRDSILDPIFSLKLLQPYYGKTNTDLEMQGEESRFMQKQMMEPNGQEFGETSFVEITNTSNNIPSSSRTKSKSLQQQITKKTFAIHNCYRLLQEESSSSEEDLKLTKYQVKDNSAQIINNWLLAIDKDDQPNRAGDLCPPTPTTTTLNTEHALRLNQELKILGEDCKAYSFDSINEYQE